MVDPSCLVFLRLGLEAAQHFLDAVQHRLRGRGRGLEDVVDLSPRDQLDFGFRSLGVLQELRVLHRGREGVPQNVQALGRQTRRREKRPAERLPGQQEIEGSAIGGVRDPVLDAWDAREARKCPPARQPRTARSP